MQLAWRALAVGAVCLCGGAFAGVMPPVTVEVVAPDGRTFREIPVNSRDGAVRSYLQAEKGAHYEVRIRNSSGERLGLVIAVDGRNIISGKRSDLARTEPMYVLDAWDTQSYAGWRASLEAINKFHFTDWKDSYAEAFGDRSARGVIAIAVYREVRPPAPASQPFAEGESGRVADAQGAASRAKAGRSAESPGTGYGERRIDHAMPVEFEAQSNPESRHYIKYEWRETLCRKQLLECEDNNRFWDESVLGFAPPPPRR